MRKPPRGKQPARRTAQRVAPRRAPTPSAPRSSDLTRAVRAAVAAAPQLGQIAPLPLVGPRACAAHLGISLNTLRREITTGKIPHARIGHQLRFDMTKVRKAYGIE